MARKELHAAVHCHHEDVTAVSMTKLGLLPLTQEAQGLKLSYHPFEGAATDTSERLRMAKSLGPVNRNMILENHGPLCCGETLPEAMQSMYTLMRAASYQVKALGLVGGDITKLNLPTDAELQDQISRLQKKPE